MNTLHHPRCPHESIHASSTNSACDDLQVLSNSKDSPHLVLQSSLTHPSVIQCHCLSTPTEEFPKQEAAPGKNKSTKDDGGTKQPQKGFIHWSTPTSPLVLRTLGLKTSSRLRGSRWQSVCLVFAMEFCHQEPTKQNELSNRTTYTLFQTWTEIIHFGKICWIIHHVLIIYPSGCLSKFRLQRKSNGWLWSRQNQMSTSGRFLVILCLCLCVSSVQHFLASTSIKFACIEADTASSAGLALSGDHTWILHVSCMVSVNFKRFCHKSTNYNIL